jgi:FemAB-related protein (PEP-CTERM system-associated)
VSTPFCVYGGILASNERAHAALTEHACRLAEQLQVEDLELRNLAASRSGWPTKDLYVTFRKSIAGNTEENLKAIPRKQRAMVRKGIDAGLQGSVTDEPDRVYRIYAESVRNLGTPVFGKHYFRALAESFGSACEISVIRHGDRDIAGVMSFYFKDQVLPYYGGSLPVARALKGNDFMYWDLMCRATERGARLFDFGRSKVGTGPYSFKKNWGFHPEPLNYEYYLVKARDVPRLDPANPKYERLVNLWRQLPLPIANLLGPMLARDLG